MSGAMKSGLIFAAVGLIGVLATAFIPGPGSVLCGPLLAVIVGGVAGFYGVRWTSEDARVSRGVLAGTLAGLGMVVGAVIGYVVLFNSLSTDPLFQEQLGAFLEQRPDVQVDQGALGAAVGLAGVVAGLCFGLLNLLLALAFGALGGWLALRGRPGPSAPPAPPLG
ncbi:MAG TPA: hypothetical protein VFU22_29200 [Roseiflexaceae bacterium]|nr:hypothetical protein [Roseiflexaceae bacterium]